MTELESREQLVRIDKALADIDVSLADAALKREQLRQLKTIEPWRVLIAGITALGAWSAFLVFALGRFVR
jgi:hypothetical protein